MVVVAVLKKLKLREHQMVMVVHTEPPGKEPMVVQSMVTMNSRQVIWGQVVVVVMVLMVAVVLVQSLYLLKTCQHQMEFPL